MKGERIFFMSKDELELFILTNFHYKREPNESHSVEFNIKDDKLNCVQIRFVNEELK